MSKIERTISEILRDARLGEKHEIISAFHSALEYVRHEDSMYWKAEMIHWNIGIPTFEDPDVDDETMDETIHWMENEVAKLEEELELAKLMLKVISGR